MLKQIKNKHLYLSRLISISIATLMTVLLISGSISPVNYLIFWVSAVVSWVLF